MLIGLLLGSVAILLERETKELLVGEGANRDLLRAIRQIAQSEGTVERAGYPLTMYFGPKNALLAMKIQFRPDLHAGDIEESIDRIETVICSRYPDICHVFLEAERVRTTTRTMRSGYFMTQCALRGPSSARPLLAQSAKRIRCSFSSGFHAHGIDSIDPWEWLLTPRCCLLNCFIH